MPKNKKESSADLSLFGLSEPIKKVGKIKKQEPEQEKKEKYRVDLFGKLIPEISLKKLDYYNSFSDEYKKEVQPYIVMRALTGTKERMQVVLLNEFVNLYVWSIGYKHKDLIMKLLTACAPGRQQFYKWIPYSQKKPSNVILEVIKEYFNYSTRRAIEVLPLLSDADIINYAMELGRQTDELKKIKERQQRNNTKNS